jgi:hypothetical protein
MKWSNILPFSCCLEQLSHVENALLHSSILHGVVKNLGFDDAYTFLNRLSTSQPTQEISEAYEHLKFCRVPSKVQKFTLVYRIYKTPKFKDSRRNIQSSSD